MPAALHMPEPELIDHAGLDSAVYLRIYLIGYDLLVILFNFCCAFCVICLWWIRGLISIEIGILMSWNVSLESLHLTLKMFTYTHFSLFISQSQSAPRRFGRFTLILWMMLPQSQTVSPPFHILLTCITFILKDSLFPFISS
jgi:hypothetical protein